MALLTPEDAARELAISTKQIRALTCAGEIRYINIGLGAKRETRRYAHADLEQFREKRSCQSINAQDKRPTPTTSVVVVHDFQARRNARRAERQNGSKKPSGPKSRPRAPTAQRP